jgi:hypothetical protein
VITRCAVISVAESGPRVGGALGSDIDTQPGRSPAVRARLRAPRPEGTNDSFVASMCTNESFVPAAEA